MGDPIASALNIKDFFNSGLTPLQIGISLFAAFLAGGYIFFIYKMTFGGVLYSRTFNLSLITITMVTTLVIMLINTNLTLSLGMVGALSIIRFRTAVKDPMDTAFLFWSVGEGLALGARLFDVAVMGLVFIGLILVLITVVKFRSSLPFLLILHFHEDANPQIKNAVSKLRKTRVRSRTAQREGIELTLEIRLKDEETAIVDKFLRIDGVYDATLIAHQGDMIS